MPVASAIMSPDRRGLAFLLSIGGLPIACAPENDKIPDDEDATTSTGGTGTSTTDAVTTSATGFLSTGETYGSYGTTGPPVPPPPPEAPACIAYYNTLRTCFPDERPYYAAYYAAYCDMLLVAALRADGQPCADAIAAHFTCLSELSCALFFGDAPQCVEESDAADAACPMLLG